MLLRVSAVIALSIVIKWTPTTNAGKLDWWQNAVIYQIYPRSFKDSDNDGNGDLRGIIEELDELVDTGVTAIWLSPIYKSPKRDNGYDISNYTDIDEMYGTMDDFKELVATAKRKGLKVILDFVPNHTSHEHEWFKKSEAGDAGYENFYVWKDGSKEGKPPNNWLSYFHGPAWTYSEQRKKWYFHQFSTYQPDLNYREPKVVQAMKDILTFWLNTGVDGFRIDIISALFEEFSFGDLFDFIFRSDRPETFDMVYQWRTLLDNYQKEHKGDTRIMMTESYSLTPIALKYYGNDTHNGAHFPFNFNFITDLKRNSDAGHIKFIIDKWFFFMKSKYTANWVLGNHDKTRVATRFGEERIDGLIMLTMLLPGVTVTYQGEEIGMTNGEVSWEEGDDPQGCNGDPTNWNEQSRDFERTPYQWDGSVNAGFNEGHKTWLPVASNYKTVNRFAQKAEGLASHYHIYQETLKLKKSETLKYGSHNVVSLTKYVLGLKRELEGHPTYVLLLNVGNKTERVNLTDLNVSHKFTVKIPSLQSDRKVKETIETDSITLQPYEALILTNK